MSTYRHGSWTSYDNVDFYSIDKKTFLFGWQEVVWWHKNKEGYEKMMRAVESLERKGHIIL